MARSDKGGFLDTLKTVLYAVLIAMVVRTFGFEPFNIPSGSMVPTLLVGDYLFVSKSSYGYSKHSLMFSLPLIPGRVWFTEPERGDVAVFKLPSDNSTDYIKRIVGLPGEKIQMKNGRLFINGTIVKRERISDFVQTGVNGSIKMTAQFKETFPSGKTHNILEEWGDTGPLDNTREYEVPANH